jgi:hypothetical protein
LKLAGAGAVSVAAAALVRPRDVLADTGETITVDNVFDGHSTTQIRSDDATATASNRGAAIFGRSTAGQVGVLGQSSPNAGVTEAGYVDAHTGVVGQAIDPGGTGVLGEGSLGVYGYGGVGAVGDAGYGGTGVYGFAGANPPPGYIEGTGVIAEEGDLATAGLQVIGRARFSQSGRATIPASKSSVLVNLPWVTQNSLVFAVLAKNVTGRHVRSVVPALDKFTIYLNKAVAAATPVTWIVFDPSPIPPIPSIKSAASTSARTQSQAVQRARTVATRNSTR